MQKIFIFISLLPVIIIGCATVPGVRVAQPWVRTLRIDSEIPSGSRFKIEVIGKTVPLLGNELLTAEKIKKSLTYLLVRRGFSIDDQRPDFIIQVNYKTCISEKVRFSSTFSSYISEATAMATGTGVGVSSGYGVSIAKAVVVQALRTASSVQTSYVQGDHYTHTLGIEITKQEGNIVFKSDVTLDSKQLDITSQIIPAIQIVLSNLPQSVSTRPEVPEVKISHIENYYSLECKNYEFTCPALPYRILFDEEYRSKWDKSKLPNYIKDPYALPAYVDLITTAEYALPKGDKKDWQNPIILSLWEKVTLGGQYLIGPSKKPINIIVNLKGKYDGYYIEKCQVVSDVEYSVFKTKMTEWQEALRYYYDVYVR